MSIQALIHNATKMEADRNGDVSWLTIEDGKYNRITVFMDYHIAQEIAELWGHMTREPEPPTYDEALAMKCDAEARTDEARRLKGMTV